MSAAVRPLELTRVQNSCHTRGNDVAAVEEPLEIRLHGEPFAVIMRTPGHDRELAVGFLFAERVIRSLAELGTVEHCGRSGNPEDQNVIQVTLAGDLVSSVLAQHRRTLTTAACGVCGRATIESLRTDAPRVGGTWKMRAEVVTRLSETLRTAQTVFHQTGGLHAAALCRPDGELEDVAEDVGRHNAVDKVIGRMLLDERLPLDGFALFVSGRTSFEILQKAWLAGIPIVAAVSAPSSLAVDLAREAGITLLGFVRNGSFNIYTHGERIA